MYYLQILSPFKKLVSPAIAKNRIVFFWLKNVDFIKNIYFAGPLGTISRTVGELAQRELKTEPLKIIMVYEMIYEVTPHRLRSVLDMVNIVFSC